MEDVDYVSVSFFIMRFFFFVIILGGWVGFKMLIGWREEKL